MPLHGRDLTSEARKSDDVNTTIKNLPVSIRPRERLAAIGPGKMSDIELLAIVLGTGTRGLNSMRMAQGLLARFKRIGSLGAADFSDVASINGIGPAKAAQLLAAVELGKRACVEESDKKISLTSPAKVAKLLIPKMRDLEEEHFKALILDTKNQLLRVVDVAVGTLNAAIVHPREIFKIAIKANAAGLIVAHNHPSGDTSPSREDITLTRRLAEAGRILGIEFIDHIIIGDGCWLSLKEKGYFADDAHA
ncbi:MAG TPA: JAB domain-containing protein [Actinobacteria bacterium]|nr:JAB domain-containing protein [Actinomycetota bacterium]